MTNMARKASDKLKVKFGKGVMDKHGKHPYAAKTMHVTSKDGFTSPCDYTIKNIGVFLMNDDYTEMQIIDENNEQTTITKRI